MSNTSFQCLKKSTLGHWPLDVDSTDHHHLTIVQVCYKCTCFFFSPQEENPGNVVITKTDAHIHGE